MPTLLALFGPKRGVRLEIEVRATLGRSSDADLQLVDAKVSRLHCRFEVGEGGQVQVEDLGSQNGTYVNGVRIDNAQRLKAGDEIAVGDSLFVMDGDADVIGARFGDVTLIVTPGRPDQAPPGTTVASELGAAARLATALRACGDLEAAARAVLAAMESALGPRRAFVLLWDAARDSARPLVGRADEATISISRTVLNLAMRWQRGLAVEDAVEDRELRDARSVARHQLRAVLVAPVVIGGQVAGFLHADRERPAFTPDDVALAECFAAVFALSGHVPAPAGARASEASRRAASRSDPLADPSAHPVASASDAPVGVSQAWQAALRTAEASAAVTSTLLITGESGTGKEEIAQYVHRRGARATGPFVAVNCGAIPESLAESALFGHERGAFTGASSARAGSIEAADGGTLFLDEVGELPAAMQVRLLRVLQERAFCRLGSNTLRRVDVRIIAATHRDLEGAVKLGRFREDLFYRLAVIRLHLLPLRERPDDIEPVARALLARVAARLRRADPGVAERGVAVLRRWRWAGNARELGNVLERALVLRPPMQQGPLDAEELAVALGDAPAAPAPAAASLAQKVAGLERTEIERALRQARGVKSRAATALGLSRPTLDKKIADLEIDMWRDAADGDARAVDGNGNGNGNRSD